MISRALPDQRTINITVDFQSFLQYINDVEALPGMT